MKRRRCALPMGLVVATTAARSMCADRWPVAVAAAAAAAPSSSCCCCFGGGASSSSTTTSHLAFVSASQGGEHLRFYHGRRNRKDKRTYPSTAPFGASSQTPSAEQDAATSTGRAGITISSSQHASRGSNGIHLGELTEADRQRLLRRLLVEAAHLLGDDGMLGDGYESETLGRGFCNWVYKVTPASSSLVGGDDNCLCNAVVVKVFSDLAKVRVPDDILGSIDVLASDCRIGPTVMHRGSDGIVMEYIDGTVLTEEDVHGIAKDDDDPDDMKYGDGQILCEKIGAKLAQLHSTSIPSNLAVANEVDNMLWRTLDAMLGFVGEDGPIPEAVLEAGWTHDRLCQEVHTMRQKLDALELPQVLCHGDFKPSNIVVVNDSSGGGGVGGIVLIDYELSGPGYRGFDFYKLFRTADPSRQNDDNMAAFVRSYLRSTDRRDKDASSTIGAAQVEQVLAEMKLFEPLTWLEAGIFFLFAAKGDPTQTERWEKLALDRFSNFDASKGRFQANLEQYFKAVR